LRFSGRWSFRCWYFGFIFRVILDILTDVSEEPTASNFRLSIGGFY
jgi:hypothetical protein